METLRILVTGCSGFLGRHLVNALERGGYEVAGFDLAEPNYSLSDFIKGDLASAPEVDRALRGADAVCHLGGVGDVYLAERDPAQALRANAFGTKVLCDACKAAGVRKLLYASTWEVYGKSHTEVVDESHACNPESAYSISKLAGELFVRQLRGSLRVDAVALRLGTAYGRWMRSSAVISRFLNRARHGEALTIFGDGNQFRQFTHTTDIANAFVLCLGSECRSGIYNVVAEERVSIYDLALQIGGAFGASIDFQDSRPSEPPSAYVSSRLAQRELGWKQQLKFAEGLRMLLEDAGPSEVA